MQFTFAVLSYNHEKFIIEHLESIKFQIIKFGKKYKIHIILIDDFSSDNTYKLARLWLKENKKLFKKIICKKNKKNLKTCKSFVNICKLISTKWFKITGSDDIYSNVNIFNEYIDLKNTEFRAYLPLILKGNDLKINLKSNFLLSLRNYNFKSFYELVRKFPVLNTPNTVYPYNYIKKKKVLSFVSRFKIIEDWPFWLAISKSFFVDFVQKKSTIIYYRRTDSSAYLIRNKEFRDDKEKILDYLFKFEADKVAKNLYKMRKKFYFSKLKIILDLNYIIFTIRSLKYFIPALTSVFTNNYFLVDHKKHYLLIKQSAKKFLNKNYNLSYN
jgi:hypothetical protein